jgi:TolA-binding protein
MKSTYIFILIFQFFLPNITAQSIADKFDSGMRAYHLKLYAEANKIFEDVIENYGNEDELYASAHYYSADALLKMGKREEAASKFEFISNNIVWSNFRGEALFSLGMIYFDDGRFAKSRKNF